MWDGGEPTVIISAIEGAPLIGMRLPADHELTIHVAEGGRVVIQSLTNPA